jgi:hypothetical protein
MASLPLVRSGDVRFQLTDPLRVDLESGIVPFDGQRQFRNFPRQAVNVRLSGVAVVPRARQRGHSYSLQFQWESSDRSLQGNCRNQGKPVLRIAASAVQRTYSAGFLTETLPPLGSWLYLHDP